VAAAGRCVAHRVTPKSDTHSRGAANYSQALWKECDLKGS